MLFHEQYPQVPEPHFHTLFLPIKH
jgi:hypothetical protein